MNFLVNLQLYGVITFFIDVVEVFIYKRIFLLFNELDVV